MTQTSLPFFLVLLFLFSTPAISQYTSSAPYNPEKLVCATGVWFDQIIHDTSHAGLLIEYYTDVGDCRRGCFDSDYHYSYWQNSTQRCYCSYDLEVPAREVGNTMAVVDGCWSGSLARLDYLPSSFSNDFCTSRQTTISAQGAFLHGYTSTILFCIALCGDTTVQRPFITIAVSPKYDVRTSQYRYDCECYASDWFTGLERAAPCGKGVRHIFTRSYVN